MLSRYEMAQNWWTYYGVKQFFNGKHPAHDPRWKRPLLLGKVP